MKAFLKNEDGLSLVSVTVAAGIMGMLAVYMMKMQENQLKTQNDMIIRNEVSNFMTKLNGFLSRPGYCEKTFGEEVISPSSNILIDELIAPNGRVVYKTGEKYGDNSFRLVSIKQDKFFYDTDKKDMGILTLKVSMERLKKSFGSKILNKTVDVVVSLDKGKLTGCGTMAAGGGLDIGTVSNLDPVEVQKALIDPSKADPITKKSLEETIKNNPTLKMMQESIKSIQNTNSAYKRKEDKALKNLNE